MFWILQQIVFSVIIILLIHYLYNYLKESLTTPKIKSISTQDNHYLEKLIQTTEKQEQVLIENKPNEINKTNEANKKTLNINHDKNSKNTRDGEDNKDDKDNEDNEDDMKNTLKNYIKQLQFHTDNNTVKTTPNTNINSLPEMN